MKMTLHTTPPPTFKLHSTRKKGHSVLKFCMRPYLTKLTTTKHNLTLPQLQEQLKRQHQGQHQEQDQGQYQKQNQVQY